ncbi:hypothetical protein DOY81_006437 [Sarcophaga bullata]|nr:hypothetical protein DOY81_006437 [Sarcophaga bullata]
MQSKQDLINPNTDLLIPPWVTKEYFKTIVENDEPEAINIKSFTPIAAIAPGENYTSTMLRIHMDLEMKGNAELFFLEDGSLKSKYYILKTMLEYEKGGDLIEKLALFPKEMKMYEKYLPAFENLYKAVGWHIKIAPKCLFVEQKEGEINFVFEDLKQQNFININRLEGCDINQMRYVLRRLAEFHAASAVYEEQNGAYPKDFHVGFVDLEAAGEYHRNAFKTKLSAYKKAMQLWGMEDADKILKEFPTCDQYWKCCLSTLQQHENKFNVLTHGDFWSSNVMFNYSGAGILNEVIFLDYQFCKWGSPAEDLLFIITISAAKDIRIQEFDHFVAIYHERLVECLKVLGFKHTLPKLRDLQKDMFDEKNSFYAFYACFNHLSQVLLPSNKDSSIQAYCRPDEIGEQFRMKAFTNPRYVEAMKQLFPFFYRKGLFRFTDYD